MPLHVSVLNGDLAFIAEPLLVGHYISLGLTGSEAAVDRLLAGKLQRSLSARDYPEEPGSTKVFRNTRLPADNPWQLPRPCAVVVTGLGQEGALRAQDLKSAVANGVVTWALHAEETRPDERSLRLAATLIGSGGLNISAGQSAQLVVQAVLDANARLLAVDVPEGGPCPPLVEHLTLVDLYLDRASEAWRALTELRQGNAADFTLDPQIARRDAALDRPLESSYRGSSYDLVVATWEETGDGSASVHYRLDTRRARSEIQAQSAQITLLRQLLGDGSNPDHLDGVLGRSLFKLLVPVELAPVLAGSAEMQIEVDAKTAAIPWELLDTPRAPGSSQLPWAMRTKLLRKLRTAAYRSKVVDAPEDAGVLIIGEPACPKGYSRLPGARREARAVQAAVRAVAWKVPVRALIASDAGDLAGPDGRDVMRVLLDKPWRVIHICGHGEAALPGNPRGVVLSDGAFLGAREVANMQPVPELVVLNCCFAGAHSAAELDDGAGAAGGALADSPRFAANIADQLIAIGVRCVVATGWAIDDDAAEAFASAFYAALLRGARFIDAVDQARQAAYAKKGNTWAAYQCYGDPDWRLRQVRGDAQTVVTPLAAALARVTSVPGLILALRTLAVRARYHHDRDEAARGAVTELARRFEGAWAHQGEVAEAFGHAWLAIGDRKQASDWFERAVRATDGSATFKTAEHLLNLRARAAYDGLHSLLAGFGGQPAALTAEQSGQLQTQAASAIGVIEGVVESLGRLSAVAETAERANLCGSACKRLAQVHHALQDHDQAAACTVRMHAHYLRGWQLSQDDPKADIFYSAMNVLAAAVASGQDWDPVQAEQVRQLVQAHHQAGPNFWNVMASVEIVIWEAVALSRVEQQGGMLKASLADLHDRLSDPSMWNSVLDQTRFVVTARGHRIPVPPAEQAAVDALLVILSAYAR